MKNHLMKFIAVLLICVTLIACSTTWIDTAMKDLPVAVQIVQSIITIVSTVKGTPDDAAISQVNVVAAEVQGDLTIVKGLITDYNNAPDAAGQAAVITKLNAALNTTQTHLNDLLSAAHFKNTALRDKVTVGVGLVMSVVLAVESLLPSPATAASSGSKKAANPVKLLSPNDLRKQFNSAVQADFPYATI